MRIVHLTSVHHWRDPRISSKMMPTVGAAGYDAFLIACTEERGAKGSWTLVGVGTDGSRLRKMIRVYKAAAELQPDVVHLHDPELLPAAYLLHRKGCSVVYDMHENYLAKGGWRGRVIRYVEKSAFRWLDHVVLAEESYQTIVPESVSATVVLNYHQEEVRSRARSLPGEDETFNVVYTGVQSRLRGLDTILAVADRAEREGRPWHFSLAGICHSRVERESAEKFIAEMGLSDMISLHGWDEFLAPEKISEIRNSAHVGLVLLRPHGNYVGSIPTKFYEYMASGVPFLCSDFPIWREFVSQHECGAVCNPVSEDEVWQGLVRLSSQAENYQALSTSALAAAPRFHWREMEERLLSVYASVDATRKQG